MLRTLINQALLTKAMMIKKIISPKWVRSIILLSVLFLTTACSTVHFNGVSVDKKGNTVVSAIDSADNQKINELYQAIMSLGPNILPNEAKFVAREAVLYPKVLANRYKLTSPPLYHNVLVNYGKRPRGLCYQWTRDMGLQINRPMKSLQFFHAVAFRRNYWKEHSTLVVAAKGKGVPDGIILDPWRNSGNLFWSRVKDDHKYPWVQFTN